MSLRRRKGIVPCLPFSLSLPPSLSPPPTPFGREMPTGSLATRNLNARFLGQPFVYRSYPERIRREQRCSSRMHTCPTLGPRRGKRESFVVPGSPRDTVNINKRSQEAVSRSVDFIGSSRLSSFRFFFQQPAITPGCSFTRPPLPRYSVSCNRRQTPLGWSVGRKLEGSAHPDFLSFASFFSSASPPRPNSP